MTRSPRARDVRLALASGALVLLACSAAAWAHFAYRAPIARGVLGVSISDAGFLVQLVALVAGATCLPLVEARWRARVIIAQGSLCLAAWGVFGAVFLAVLIALWGLFEMRGLGRARFVVAAAAIAGPSACAAAQGMIADAGLVFAVMFGLRLAVYGYERWQDDEPVALEKFLAYMLIAPLVVVPPYMAFAPLFTSYEPAAPSRARLFAAIRHLVLASVFGGLLWAVHGAIAWHSLDDVAALRFYGRLVVELLTFAALVHLVLAALLVHGVELRSPIDRPVLATSFVELWRRFGAHLRDAQMFLFFTPAMLVLRRMNRYAVLILASAWTMVIGNTVLHVALRYCFLADPWPRIGAALVANSVMAIAIAAELCLEERRRRRGTSRTRWGRAVGWAVAMTLAALVLAL